MKKKGVKIKRILAIVLIIEIILFYICFISNNVKIGTIAKLDKEIPLAYTEDQIKQTDDGFKYVIKENDVIITGYTGEKTEITIPSKIENKNVIKIETNAFRENENLRNVVISEGIRAIGERAFLKCKNLTDITIQEGVKEIGVHAFWGCTSLTNITIPKGVISIGEWAFEDCTSLTDITIPEGVISIKDGTFSRMYKFNQYNNPKRSCLYRRCCI